MTDGVDKSVIFIAGPTASGKSALALAIAEAIGAEIVNADAIQVYRDLEILSARPTEDELRRAPHHLFAFLGGAERCSAGRWARAAAESLAGIAARGRPAIVVGGTGLYFRALEDGLSPTPDTPPAVRSAAQTRMDELGAAQFRDEVVGRDPAMARLAAGDTQRLLRAWEVREATGRPLSYFQSLPRTPLAPPPRARIVIEPVRPALYAACDARFEAMMAGGALEEASALKERRLDPGLPVMKALGAAELMRHLAGDLSLDEAIDLARRNTRRFAKRQQTWFRNQAGDWARAENWRAGYDKLMKDFSA